MVEVVFRILEKTPGPLLVALGAQAATLREVLIGNSFLRHVQMQRSGDTMTLIRGNGI